MDGQIFKPLIEVMVWSYSRVLSFLECRYRWYMKYILGEHGAETFYASYGSFMHKLLERFYGGQITKDEMMFEFLSGFSEQVRGDRPQESTVAKYIQDGIKCIDNLEPFQMNAVGVELKVKYEIEGIPFIGVIDYLGELDGEYYIIDHKSRALKPRSKRKKPTKNDNEIDEMMRQLYLYSAAVKQLYGKYPAYLCINCFRNGTFIKEPFDIDKYNETMRWVKNTVAFIEDNNDFSPNIEDFRCYNLCGYRDECVYWNNR